MGLRKYAYRQLKLYEAAKAAVDRHPGLLTKNVNGFIDKAMYYLFGRSAAAKMLTNQKTSRQWRQAQRLRADKNLIRAKKAAQQAGTTFKQRMPKPGELLEKGPEGLRIVPSRSYWRPGENTRLSPFANHAPFQKETITPQVRKQLDRGWTVPVSEYTPNIPMRSNLTLLHPLSIGSGYDPRVTDLSPKHQMFAEGWLEVANLVDLLRK